MIRAKMHLRAIIPSGWGGMKAVFMCQYDNTIEEDKKFQKATPSGNAEFCMDNPHAFDQLVQGGDYYFDITPCDTRSDGMNEKERLLRKLRAHIDAGGSVSIEDRTYTKQGDDIVVTNASFKALPKEHTEGPHPTAAGASSMTAGGGTSGGVATGGNSSAA